VRSKNRLTYTQEPWNEENRPPSTVPPLAVTAVPQVAVQFRCTKARLLMVGSENGS
jgi:hypothetical protein